MGDKTAIQWTDATWNPLAGCSMVSAGCTNCYAMREAHRLAAMGSAKYEGLTVIQGGRPVWNGTVRLWEKQLDQPLRWKTPRRIFVNSMSDLFHESVAFEDIKRIWGVAAQAQQHTFQVLTKRAERMREFSKWLAGADDISIAEWPRNVWLGVSVEDQKTADERIPELLRTPAAVRWISAEPLLGSVNLQTNRNYLRGVESLIPPLSWVVVGGESGPNARPMELKWARGIVAQCKSAGVPVFVKQLGIKPISDRDEGGNWEKLYIATPGARSVFSGEYGNDFLTKKGGNPEEWPEDLRVREYPVEAEQLHS